MYRVAFAIDDSRDRQDLVAALRRVTIADARIVAAFADPKAVDVYLDISDTTTPRQVAEALARLVDITEYEVTRVDEIVTEVAPLPAPAEPENRAVAISHEHLRRAVIT